MSSQAVTREYWQGESGEILSNVVGEWASLGRMISHADRLRDVLRNSADAHAILEDDPVQHIGQLLIPAQPMPARGRGLDELEDHRQRREPRAGKVGDGSYFLDAGHAGREGGESGGAWLTRVVKSPILN